MTTSLKPHQIKADMRSVKLAFKCSGLECSPSSTFESGMLTGLLNRAKSTATTKVERRSILISTPLSRGGDFADVYRSEVIDDSSDINPSLVAEINCENAGDTLIRVRIQYSSTMTSGKDFILCETMLSINEITAGKLSKVSMTSKYLKGNALLEILVIEPFRPLLSDSSFSPIAKANIGNPYKQSYLFHSEEQSRSVYCEEYGLETRISVAASIAFLEETRKAITDSRSAWAARRDLEIIRQGHFTSLSDGLKQGWHQITISVIEAKIPDDNDFSPLRKSALMTPDDDDTDVNDGDKNGPQKPRRGPNLRKAITTLKGVSGSRKKGCDVTKTSSFVEISMSTR